MQETDGAELAVTVLAASGVELAFMLHGAHIDPIYQACLEHGIRIVSVRHEAAAGHAAEGYARAGRRLGVALVTAGPGVTNVVTSIANANLDRTPVLYLAGGASAAEDEANALQSGVDQVALARPVTKWAHRVVTTGEIPRLVAQAIRIATTPPAGPVFLEIPADVLHGRADGNLLRTADGTELAARICPSVQDIEAALQLLRAAERPAVMAGGDVYASGAWDELRAFASSASLPVFAQYEALGIVPPDDPLWAGTLWQLPLLPRPLQPDLVLALGVRFGWHAPGFLTLTEAEVVHIEVDPREIGRPRPPRLAIIADCREALDQLTEQVKLAGPFPDRSAWARDVRAAISEGIAAAAVMPPGAVAGIHPYQAAKVICGELGPDAIIVGDGAFVKHWFDDVIAPSRPGSYFTHGSLGAMGIGLGLAIGARLACPDRTVACVTGDGSAGFSIAEFDTMVRRGIPVVAIVLNNSSWGEPVMPARSGASYPTVGTDLSGTSYAAVAAGFGAFARSVERLEDLAPAIRAAISSGKPACVDVRIAPGFQRAFSMRALRMS
jgi:acetolactate synthase I/II/III large subunit